MDAAKTKGTAPLVEYDVARDQYIQIRFYSPAPGYYACCLQEVTAQQKCLFDANHYHEDSVQTAKELFESACRRRKGQRGSAYL